MLGGIEAGGTKFVCAADKETAPFWTEQSFRRENRMTHSDRSSVTLQIYR